MLSCVGSLAIGLPCATSAQTSGNPAAGRELALQRCSACHNLADRSSGVTRGTASFPDIAGMRSSTDVNLRSVLQYEHKPELLLRRRSVDDLVAFILSLRGD